MQQDTGECTLAPVVVDSSSRLMRSAPNGAVVKCYPEVAGVDGSLPEKAHEYLKQALNSLHTPAGP